MEQELISKKDKEKLEKIPKRPLHFKQRGKNELYRTPEFLKALE